MWASDVSRRNSSRAFAGCGTKRNCSSNLRSISEVVEEKPSISDESCRVCASPTVCIITKVNERLRAINLFRIIFMNYLRVSMPARKIKVAFRQTSTAPAICRAFLARDVGGSTDGCRGSVQLVVEKNNSE